MEIKVRQKAKKGVSPIILGAAGIALGVGAAAAVTYKSNKKFQKRIDGIISDTKEQSESLADQIKKKFVPKVKQIEHKTTKRMVSKTKTKKGNK